MIDFFPIANNSAATPGLFNKFFSAQGVSLGWFTSADTDYADESMASAMSYIRYGIDQGFGPRTLYVPPGTHNFRAPIQVLSDVRLEGIGLPELFFELGSAATGGVVLDYGASIAGFSIFCLGTSSSSMLGIAAPTGYNTIERNRLDGWNVNIEIGSRTLNPVPNVVVRDNDFTSFTIGNTEGRGRSVVITGAPNAQITNNFFSNNPVAAIEVEGGLAQTRGVVVQGNIFSLPFGSIVSNTGTYALKASGYSSTASVAGLRFIGNVVDVATTTSNQSTGGVLLNGWITDSAVIGNFIRGTTVVGVLISSVDTSSSSRNIVAANNFELSTGTNVWLLGSSGVGTHPEAQIIGNSSNFPNAYDFSSAASATFDQPSPRPPASSVAAGVRGMVAFAPGFQYVCQSSGSWHRVATTGY